MIGKDACISDIYQFYQTYLNTHRHFVPLDQETFKNTLIHGQEVLLSYNQRIDGFLSCHIEGEKAYISILLGEKDIQKELLGHLEKNLRLQDIKSLYFHFLNPVNLPWFVKGDMIHPNNQGVLVDSDLYVLLHELNYHDHTYQQTYVQSLDDFDEMQVQNHERICFYQKEKHHGLHDFVQSLGVKTWTEELISNDCLKNPLPLLVALDQSKVIGFAGPLKVQDNGRGYFAGIAIDSDYRKKGLGYGLFSRLTKELKAMGALYMTFFTGSNNPARHIYTRLGFQVAKTFACMKKTL